LRNREARVCCLYSHASRCLHVPSSRLWISNVNKCSFFTLFFCIPKGTAREKPWSTRLARREKRCTRRNGIWSVFILTLNILKAPSYFIVAIIFSQLGINRSQGEWTSSGAHCQNSGTSGYLKTDPSSLGYCIIRRRFCFLSQYCFNVEGGVCFLG
jgi:hypothetical protein